MVQIQVEYYGRLSIALKTKKEVFEFDLTSITSVKSVMDHITNKYAGKTGKYPLKLQEGSRYHIVVNGKIVSNYDTILKNGDTIKIVRPVAGG